jgi:hypothetical protein
MKYASVVPKEVVSHYVATFDPPNRNWSFQMKLWEENKTSFMKTLVL